MATQTRVRESGAEARRACRDAIVGEPDGATQGTAWHLTAQAHGGSSCECPRFGQSGWCLRDVTAARLGPQVAPGAVMSSAAHVGPRGPLAPAHLSCEFLLICSQVSPGRHFHRGGSLPS